MLQLPHNFRLCLDAPTVIVPRTLQPYAPEDTYCVSRNVTTDLGDFHKLMTLRHVKEVLSGEQQNCTMNE